MCNHIKVSQAHKHLVFEFESKRQQEKLFSEIEVLLKSNVYFDNDYTYENNSKAFDTLFDIIKNL